MSKLERKPASATAVILSFSSLGLVVIGGIVSVNVALGQGQLKDEQHDKKIDKIEQHIADHDKEAVEDRQEIIEILHDIQLDMKDKQDR